MGLRKYQNLYNSFIDQAIRSGKMLGKGGEVRATTGRMVEALAETIWTEETGGEVRKEKYTISNPQGHTLDFSVDKHCFSVDGEPRLVLECKAYLDRCFLARADNDLRMIKTSMGKKNRDVRFAILSLENACSAEALKFYLGFDNIDDIFFLLNGKRTSSKPIWKQEHRKELDKQLLEGFVGYVRKLQ